MVAATMDVYFDWGGTENTPGTSSEVTDGVDNKIRFKTADDHDVDSNNPIPVPGAGTNRSYWKHVYLYCTDIQDGTQIDNVKFYGDGGVFGTYTDIDLMVGDETPTKTSGSDAGYDPAVGTAGTTGTVMTDHTDITGTTNCTTYVSGSPLSVPISESGNIIDATGESSDYVVLQIDVGTQADSGTLTVDTLIFAYDEV